ncbi:unnamed protein product [Arabidopsis halleri]
MDPRNSSAWGGEADLSLVLSMGGAESKNSCCVIDDDGSTGTKLCEKPKVEKIVAQPSADGASDKDGEEKTVESFTAKKKKKKKDKGKKADAFVANSSVEAKEDKQENSISEPKKKDVKAKVAEKKVPKRVREMQEILARRKEAEERKKKEEEERLRKEEEERRIEEEREREAEEIRQKRKIRKMEKKQEGLILTAKQKREAAKNEAFRKRVLTDAGSLLVADKNFDSSKRPIYGNKNKSACRKVNDSASVQMKGDVETKENHAAGEPGNLHDLVSVDDKRVGIIESEEAHESVDVSQENGDEEDVWDAKTNFTIKGDSDDEEEKTQHVFKNELNDTASKAHDSGHGADRPTVKPGVAGKPKTDAKKAMPKVDGATWPKDTSKKGEGLVLNEVAEEVEESLRSPICCIMGHVDSGKTKLLDCIRGTNVQEGEAGGITQQIGATYFPAENIRERTKELNADAKLKVPGLLVIDTPGHESFTNLRSRGSNLCDLAILVVDIMRGLEPQTLESLNLLRRRNVKFIVALNKVDRLYGWKKSKNAPLMKTMKQQLGNVVDEFNKRVEQVKTQFQEQGLNSMLNYENREMGETISIIPTSAISGEGIPDLLLLLVQWAQKTMVEKLTYVDKVQCTVLEVKVIEGHGITVDVVLVNGVLREGDQIIVCGSQGPIVTTIRSLLTPYPMNETRVKGTYMAHREIKAAQGIKIAAQGLEHAIAGTALHVIGPNEDMEEAKKNAMEDIESVMNRIDKSGEGVYVQASTLGSLEALLEFLKSSDVKIPVCGIGIGPVHKKDIMKAGVMLEKKEEFATILAFDVKITAEARELADKMGVKIFCDDTIYRLFNKFKSYIEGIKEEKKKETACEVVFPCILQILPNHIFNKKDPIILGVKVNDGILKVGTPICILKRNENVRVIMDIGRVASIKNNNRPVDNARKGQEVAIKIIASNSEEQKKFGNHFGIEDRLMSHISRRSIDVLRTYYWEELSDDEKSLRAPIDSNNISVSLCAHKGILDGLLALFSVENQIFPANLIIAKNVRDCAFTSSSPVSRVVNLGFLVSRRRTLCSVSQVKSENLEKQNPCLESFTVSYLVDSCGLSLESAISNSRFVKLVSSKKPDSVLALFKDHGFTTDQITNVIKSFPRVLSLSPDDVILPKLMFFSSIGFSTSDTAKMISSCPKMLSHSLNKRMIPCYDSLKSILVEEENVVKCLKRGYRCFSLKITHCVSPRVSICRELGVPDKSIKWLVQASPVTFFSSERRFSELLNRVCSYGFDPKKAGFVHAMVAFDCTSEATMERKFKLFQRFGWSKEDFVAAIMRFPNCATVSDEKILYTMEYLVNNIGLQARDIVARPVVLGLSMEKRIKPRNKVISLLLSKGLVKKEDINYFTILKLKSSEFMDKFVLKHQNVMPQLVQTLTSNR